jgi:hypothetical protein
MENEKDSNTVNNEERNVDIVWKGHGVDKQPAARNTNSFINDSCVKSSDLESQVGQSKRKVIKDGGYSNRRNRLKQRKKQHPPE